MKKLKGKIESIGEKKVRRSIKRSNFKKKNLKVVYLEMNQKMKTIPY